MKKEILKINSEMCKWERKTRYERKKMIKTEKKKLKKNLGKN